MDPLQFLVPLGWLTTVGPVLPFAILVMAVANLATRHIEYRQHVEQGESDESVEQYTPHAVTNVGLLLLSFLYAVHAPTGGTILAVLVVTLVLADLFEFEARNVEARNDMAIEAPKSAIVASALVVLYAGYYALFFLIEGLVGRVIA